MQLCHCKSPDSAGNQWVWTPSCLGFLPNGHFPPPSLFFQVQSFPRLDSSILRILRQLETLPKARRGKPITLLQQQLVQPGLCKPGSRFRREIGICPPHAERSRKEKGVPVAGSLRGQRAGNRDYCGQNKEQTRKDTIAIPPICQGPAWSYLLDLTPSCQCLHPSSPESCLANEQPRWRLGFDMRGGSRERETWHRAWGILSPWAGTSLRRQGSTQA